jgi:molecular chaperone DnaK (HSP70)
MRLGVDFGTTRVVVAAVDRGNYPVVTFEGPDGVSWEWFPPLIAVGADQRLYGWDAWAAQTQLDVTVVRSVKRLLQDAGPLTRVGIGACTLPLIDWLGGMMAALRQALSERSSLNAAPGEPLEVMIGVPANANGNQRFLTTEAFRIAGFHVLGLLNEPSAASIEFAHRNRIDREMTERILVYDLGGGTFDASLVDVDARTHSVIATEGIPTLGGDEFDEVLAEAALAQAGLSTDCLNQAEHFRLLEECREKKEAVHANTRKIAVDMDRVREGLGQVAMPVADYYEQCRPMVDETARAVEDLLSRAGEPIDTLYVTGGGSELPLVARVLRETWGRRVKRSAYTRSATAIGLAIQADAEAGYLLREQFTRNFGVWREAEAGREIIFDALFERGTTLPAVGERPLHRSRRYTPVHNIGHFRYLECSHRGGDGQPVGDITSWDEIRFPFDPSLESAPTLDTQGVTHSPGAQGCVVEEAYSCDASGTVTVTISNLTAGYQREYRLGRWSNQNGSSAPTRKRRAKRSA